MDRWTDRVDRQTGWTGRVDRGRVDRWPGHVNAGNRTLSVYIHLRERHIINSCKPLLGRWWGRPARRTWSATRHKDGAGWQLVHGCLQLRNRCSKPGIKARRKFPVLHSRVRGMALCIKQQGTRRNICETFLTRGKGPQLLTKLYQGAQRALWASAARR